MKKFIGSLLFLIIIGSYAGYLIWYQTDFQKNNFYPEDRNYFNDIQDLFPNASIQTTYSNSKLYIYNNRAFISGYNYDMTTIYDISNPADPSKLGDLQMAAFDLFAYNNVIYLRNASGNYKIELTDILTNTPISIPYLPRAISNGRGVDYLANNLTIFDLNTNDIFSNYPFYSDSIQVYDMQTSGNITVLLDQDGARIMNFTNPLKISEYSSVEPPGTMKSMVLFGSNLVISDSIGTYFYNISDPINPSLISTIPGLKLTKMAAKGNYIYGINNPLYTTTELVCLDISDMNNIKLEAKNNRYSVNDIGLTSNALFYTGSSDFITNDNLISLPINPLLIADVDNDSLGYHTEKWNFNTDPENSDTDNDDIPDGWECKYYLSSYALSSYLDSRWPSGMNPLVNDVDNDYDNDGLSNLKEYQLETNPIDIDTDEDGLKDGTENIRGTNPLVPDPSSENLNLPLILFVVGLLVAFIITWIESKGYFMLKGAPLTIFLSHAVIDYEKYQLGDLAKKLDAVKAVEKTLYCEKDMRGNIDEWMDQNVPLSEVFLFIATQKSVFNSPDCLREVGLARKYGLFIICIRTPEVKWADLATIELPTQGFEYNPAEPTILYDEMKTFLDNIKANLDQLRKSLSRESLASLSTYDTDLEMKPGDSARLTRILIKEQKLTGVISADKAYYLDKGEVKKRYAQNKAKFVNQTPEQINEALGIDPRYLENVKKILKLKVAQK